MFLLYNKYTKFVYILVILTNLFFSRTLSYGVPFDSWPTIDANDLIYETLGE